MSDADDGRDEQFSAFVSASSDALLRYGYLITGDHDDAQELVQHALVKVYSSWSSIHDHEALPAYTRRVMTRERVTLWRRWRRREVVQAAMTDGNQHGHVVHNPDVETRQLLWSALQSLGGRQRVALVLRFYEDLSEAQIAEAMGCSLGTVKSQLSRGLARLRAAVGDEPFSGGSR